MKKGLLITGGLVTAFLVSFSASAYFMMNAKNLVFDKDKQEVSELNQQLESKDMEIADLKEQVERYQTLYTTAIAGRQDSSGSTGNSTRRPSATQTPSNTGSSSARTSGSTANPNRTVTPTSTVQPTQTPTQVPTQAPTQTPESTPGTENTTKPLAPDESNTSADD